jgi:cellulose synthase/poly-beta-1,6-N-acetylglucosamine synthase-like glycosyltransferase
LEIIVVDNGPERAEIDAVARRYGASYEKARWTGLSGARNAGLRASAAPVIAFLDDDAVPSGDWATHLLAPFDDPLVMAVTGRVLPMVSEDAARRRAGLTVDQDLGAEPMLVDRSTQDWFEISNFGGVGIGANMAFRRESLRVWPGFRESLGKGTPMQGGEEHNAFFHLIHAGYRVVYAPKAVVRHRYPHTLPAIRRNDFRYLAGAAGYATLLIVEEPEYRRRTIRYGFEALMGRRRPWREIQASPAAGVLSRPARLAAYACGPFLYLLSLLTVRINRLRAAVSR